MNLLNVALICFFLLANTNPRTSRQKNNHGVSGKPAIATSAMAAPKCDADSRTPDGSRDEQRQGEPQAVRVVPAPNKSWSDWIIFAGNVLLVLVGGAGVIVAIKTLGFIENQTKAIKKQADHMVQSERPFLMVEVMGDEDAASFKVSNRGRSPAKVLFMDRSLSPTYLSVGEMPPPVPEYGQPYRNIVDPAIAAEPVDAVWIAHNTHIYIGTVTPKSELQMLRESLSPGDQIGSSAIWHFGVIVYKGLFGDSYYESRYCYRLLDNQWVMLGPYGYNEYK
jgi:hypothetical protein